MKINKVKIDNFKSIEKLEIPFDKVGDSYTKIFVGINESGKSNILEALSYFDASDDSVEYDHFCNQKIEDGKDCEILFSLSLDDEEEKMLYEVVNDTIDYSYYVKFAISNIRKKVFLSKKSSEFECYYDYDVKLSDNGLYIKSARISGKDRFNIIDDKSSADGYEELTNENFDDYFYDVICNFMLDHEPKVSMWKPSKEYLLCDANLNTFKENITSNKPLKNIFKLSGYNDENSIQEIIDKIKIPRNRSRLKSKLEESINAYLSNVWDNKIDLIIEITEDGDFSLFIKDKGDKNIHDRFSITDRSQGAQQFLSLILSLSLETNNHDRKNELILIDEPEVHMHPSGIRYLSKELLKIGHDNYVFLATHSPFMIDKKHKERHYIVKKNNRAITELNRIKDSDNIIDDEVLRDAFGIDVYKDLLNPHSVIVEGASDKILLQKALHSLGYENIGVANGHGSNIETLVSKFNYDGIHALVVLDDDEDGRKDKERIIKVGGAYTEDNVFTIRDLVGDIVDKGTIEDALDPNFVKTMFIKFYKATYNESVECDFTLEQPIVKQISELLKTQRKFSKWNMDAFKKQLSEGFKPTKKSWDSDNILLKKLAEKIVQKLQLK